MYYDTYRGKNKRGGRRRREPSGCRGHFLLRLIAFVLVVAILAAVALYLLPVSFINIEKGGAQLSPKDGLPTDRVNILLLGLDFLKDGKQRSDAILIASVGAKDVRLTSVQRDLEVDIPGYGKGKKINAVYDYGGAELVMRVLNELLELNMTRYAAVDFMTMVDLVDAVGGIDLEIAENEIDYLNHYGAYTLRQINKADAQRYTHYMKKYKENIENSSPVVTAAGPMHLDGLFTVAYSRIRYADSDIGRAARQRKVIRAIVDKMRGSFYRPDMYKKLWDVYKNSVRTNLSLPEIISLGEKILLSGKIVTDSEQRIPYREYMVDQYQQHRGSNLVITDRAATVERLHEFIYAS